MSGWMSMLGGMGGMMGGGGGGMGGMGGGSAFGAKPTGGFNWGSALNNLSQGLSAYGSGGRAAGQGGGGGGDVSKILQKLIDDKIMQSLKTYEGPKPIDTTSPGTAGIDSMRY